VALPGVQMLFGFMLVAPLSDRFALLGQTGRLVFFAGFLCVTIASALLIAPSVYHRLHWRREVEDKERMLRTFTRLAIAGAMALASGMTCVVYVITDLLFDGVVTAIITLFAASLFAGLWFALPLSRRVSEPAKQPIAVDPAPGSPE
jgi:hypothetical protein